MTAGTGGAGNVDGNGRTLDRRIGLDWEAPPTTLFDVEVTVVYRDGHRETVADEHLRIVPEGLVVEGHPLAQGRRVLQVEVDWTESESPVEQLATWLRGLRAKLRRKRNG